MSSRTLLPALAVLGLALTGCESGSSPNNSDLEPAARPSLAAGVASGTPSVYATGFTYPRGLTFGPDGYLYVSEAGPAGTVSTTPEQCPQLPAPFGPYRSGKTARISRVGRHGAVTTVAEGLPSGANGLGDVLGVADVTFIGRRLYALVAGGGCAHGSADVPASVVRIGHDGGWDVVADLSAYQAANPITVPPGDFDPDGSWYSMTEASGSLIAVDANHGEIVRVNPRNGKVARITDFSATLGHVVPTAIAERRGALYVSQLGTFPGVAGSQKIWRVSPRGRLTEIATGFTMVLGLAFDRCGRLYVLETSTLDGFPTPNTGRITRLDRRGGRTTIAENLFFPTAMTFGPDGALYVSNLGFGPPLPGEVLRIAVSSADDRRDDLDMEGHRD